jgi:hypothetical protein
VFALTGTQTAKNIATSYQYLLVLAIAIFDVLLLVLAGYLKLAQLLIELLNLRLQQFNVNLFPFPGIPCRLPVLGKLLLLGVLFKK